MLKMHIHYDELLELMSDDLNNARTLIDQKKMDFDSYITKISHLTAHSKSIYSFCFNKNRTVDRTPPEEKWDAIESRVQSVHAQLSRIAGLVYLPDLKIAYEFEDMAHDTEIPIFSYHKKLGYKGLFLAPDFEIFEQNYYHQNNYHDQVRFDQKLSKAIFVGSTTGTNRQENRGCQNTLQNIHSDPSVRLEAAQCFSKNPKIVFRLPSIVQCDSKETEDYLRSFPFAHPRRIGWQEQFNYKYIISVDGNGPTLSRVAATLLSNSVLLKYESNWIAYYHRLLKPFENYIPIKNHSDVEQVILDSASKSEDHKNIARISSKIFSLLFQRANVERYFGIALNEFRALFLGKDEVYLKNRTKLEQVAHLDIDAHISNIGDVSFWPSMEISATSGNVIEGITIYPSSALFKWSDITYQVMFEDGTVSSITFGGHFVGSKNESKAIVGFRLHAISEYNFRLKYRGDFLDGTSVIADNGCWVENASSKLTRIIIEIQEQD